MEKWPSILDEVRSGDGDKAAGWGVLHNMLAKSPPMGLLLKVITRSQPGHRVLLIQCIQV